MKLIVRTLRGEFEIVNISKGDSMHEPIAEFRGSNYPGKPFSELPLEDQKRLTREAVKRQYGP